MKASSLLARMGAVGLGILAAQSICAQGAPSQEDALYAMGLNLGQQLRQSGVTNIPLQPLEKGIRDALAGKQTTGADQMRVNAYLLAESAAAAERNRVSAHEFLARNAKAAGVITTPSGLQYKIIDGGDSAAPSPQLNETVTVAFRGTFLDGREFDNSSKPGTASTFQVSGVMKGWTEALMLMKPGAKWQLFVPPELGFGQITRGGIPGGSLLIYDLQLLRTSNH
jgi:FKBP-type peptidyl-prolyl cis-trans isomerase